SFFRCLLFSFHDIIDSQEDTSWGTGVAQGYASGRLWLDKRKIRVTGAACLDVSVTRRCLLLAVSAMRNDLHGAAVCVGPVAVCATEPRGGGHVQVVRGMCLSPGWNRGVVHGDTTSRGWHISSFGTGKSYHPRTRTSMDEASPGFPCSSLVASSRPAPAGTR